MAKKQSQEDQVKRIERCLCPVHGVSLTQVPFHVEGVSFSVGACTRKDCNIRAIVDYVVEGDTADMQIRHLITPEQLDRLEQLWLGMFADFAREAGKKIEAEVEIISRSAEVQLPVSG